MIRVYFVKKIFSIKNKKNTMWMTCILKFSKSLSKKQNMFPHYLNTFGEAEVPIISILSLFKGICHFKVNKKIIIINRDQFRYYRIPSG